MSEFKPDCFMVTWDQMDKEFHSKECDALRIAQELTENGFTNVEIHPLFRTSPPALTPDERSKLVEDWASIIELSYRTVAAKYLECEPEELEITEGETPFEDAKEAAEALISTIEQRYSLVPKVRG